MSNRGSVSKTRWSRIDSSTHRLSRLNDDELWKLNEKFRTDKKTGQRIHFQCKLAPLKQLRLRNEETISKGLLEELVQQCQRVKEPTCVVYCLTDQLRMTRIKTFGSGPYHDVIPYSEIKYWCTGITQPELFAIYVEDTMNRRNKRRNCEVYQCGSENDVQQIVQLLARAQQNPDNRLRNQSRVYSVHSELLRSPESDMTEYRENSLPRLSFDGNGLPERVNALDSFETFSPVKNGHVNGNINTVESTSGQTMQALEENDLTETLHIYNGPSDDEQQTRYMNRGTERSLTPINSNEISNINGDWEQYVTYLVPDPVHGARITNDGPIYMFAMRIETNLLST